MAALAVSPLDEAHRALGAKMGPFGGWEMPIAYPGGSLAEHRACREAGVVFDVSHLGTVRLEGPGAFERLQATLCNDLGRIGPGRAQYTHLLDEQDGSVVDDIIVWWVSGERFDVMPNASNTAGVLAALGGRDVTYERAVLAVQGPKARAMAAGVLPGTDVARFGVQVVSWRGAELVVAGTGYTGEDGFECAVPAGLAGGLWAALVGAGLRPAGLGARDSLRLEAGLPLHGHELGPGITPLQAGLGWVVGWGKGDFRGRAALEAERERGPARRLRGLLMEGRRPAREHQRVHRVGERDAVGEVTSGGFSPLLERGIALALLRGEIDPGDEVLIDIRGSFAPATVVETPFVPTGLSGHKGAR